MKRIEAADPRLDVRDLQVVLAVAAGGTTVRAAQRLNLTQSAVSRALQMVEDRLGARAFDRTPHGLVPTPAGTRLIEGAGAVLAQLTELERVAREPAPVPARVRVVCECYTAYRWLPSALAKLRIHIPGIELVLALEQSRDPITALLAGELDIALITTSPVPRKLEEAPLFADEIVFVVSSSHPLFPRATLSREDLRTYPLIASSNAAPAESRWFLERVFGKSSPGVEFLHLPLTEAIMDVARAGMGVAVLSEWIASTHLGPDLVVKRLDSGPVARTWRVAYRREHRESARILASALAGLAPRIYPQSPTTI